jgi:hypothetical protein
VVETFGDLTIAIRFKTESDIDRGENDAVDLVGRKLMALDRGERSGDAAHSHQHDSSWTLSGVVKGREGEDGYVLITRDLAGRGCASGACFRSISSLRFAVSQIA